MALFKTHGMVPSEWPSGRSRAGSGRERARLRSTRCQGVRCRTSCIGAERAWAESNCYIDVWIEVLHALGLEPFAFLPHVLPVDFEGDQWTFFKPSHDDLFALYGLDVQELNVWRPLVRQRS